MNSTTIAVIREKHRVDALTDIWITLNSGNKQKALADLEKIIVADRDGLDRLRAYEPQANDDEEANERAILRRFNRIDKVKYP